MGCQCLSKENGQVIAVAMPNADFNCEKVKVFKQHQVHDTVLEKESSMFQEQIIEKPPPDYCDEQIVKIETGAISNRDDIGNTVDEDLLQYEQMNSQIASLLEINCENAFDSKNQYIDYLIIDFLRKKKFTSLQAKRDFLEYCQLEVEKLDNVYLGQLQLPQIRLAVESGVFESYCHKWYARDSLLYPLIRKTIRERNYSNLFKIRYLLSVLDIALDQCQADPVNNVYLWAVVEKKDIDYFEFSKERPVFLPGFIFTSSNISFAEEIVSKNSIEDKYPLLFTITINTKYHCRVHLLKEILNLSSDDINKNIELLNLNLFLILDEVIHNKTLGRYDVKCTLTNFENIQHLFITTLQEQREAFKDLLEKKYVNDYFFLADIYLHLGRHEESMDILGKIKNDNGDITEAKLLFQGRMSYKKGQYDNALEFYEKLVDFQTSTGTENAGTYNEMGLILYAQGNYDRAFECYEKHMKMKLASCGEEDPTMVTCYNNIGMVYFKKRDYENALKYYNKNLEIKLKTVGENDPAVATCYNNIGLVYDHQGNYEQALKYYADAVRIIRATLGDKDPSLAKSYNNMGLAYYSLKQYKSAMANYRNALDIHKEILGEKDPATAVNYTNIGSVFFAEGKLSEALNNYKMALDIKIAAYGENHPLTATGYTCVGAVYSKKEDYVRALEYYEKALKIKSDSLGDHHPDTKKIKRIRDDLEKKKHLDMN